MSTFLLALGPVLLWGASQAEPPGGKPPQALDPANPQSVLEHALYSTRTQKSYQAKFKATLSAPDGDPFKYEGTCVWVRPGVLYIHYTASGGAEKNIIRAGKEVWVDHVVGWVTADEAGMPGAGRGIQNPDDVLQVLSLHKGAAKLKKPGHLELEFKGEDIEKMMREQSQQGAFDWRDSSAAVSLEVDSENRLKRFTSTASLKPSDPKVKGPVKYDAEVEIVDYNAVFELKFRDEDKKELKLTEKIKKAIQAVLSEEKR
jgi:hypothetical protein